MVNFAERAKEQVAINDAANTLSARSRSNHRQNFIAQHDIHHYLLGGQGVSFGAPFDGVGLPSHNVTMMTITDAGELPMAVLNVGYKQENTFPKTLDVSALNNIMVEGDEIVITLPRNEEGIANATGFYYGLNSSFSQYGKIFSAVPLTARVTWHINSNATSNAFSTRSKFGKTTLLKSTMANESEFSKDFQVGVNGKKNLGLLTQALVKIPEVAEMDPITGLSVQPQYLITDRVTIKLIRK